MIRFFVKNRPALYLHGFLAYCCSVFYPWLPSFSCNTHCSAAVSSAYDGRHTHRSAVVSNVTDGRQTPALRHNGRNI